MRSLPLSICCSALLLVGAAACTGTHHRASPPPTTFGPVDAPVSLSAARAKYEQIVIRDPRDKYAWYNLAVIARYTCDPAIAATDLLKALDVDPRFEAALYLYGVNRYNDSDWNSASSYLQKAVDVSPRDANAHWVLGLALAHDHGYRPGAPNPATRQLDEALRLNPSLRDRSATKRLLNPASAKCSRAAK